MSKQTSIYLKDALEKISTLEAENAVLWAFVRTQDAEEAASPDERRVRTYYAAKAREALRQYEGGDR